MSELSTFNNWLIDFLDKEKIDLDAKFKAGDGTELGVADVITAIVKASEWERNKIRRQMFQCKAKGIPMEKLYSEYASALNSTHKVST